LKSVFSLWLVGILATAAHATPMSELAVVHTAKPAHAYTPARSEQHLVNLYNQWTHEWLALDPADHAAPPADEVDHFLRCHYTNEATTMDPRLVGILLKAAAHFHVDTIQIVSGFRHPKYNLMLRKKGHQVARDSQHTHGNAVDFYLPGVSIHDLHAWAVAQKLGGVGLYLQSGFVHMDVGKVRYWNGD
jgi:uncharacterized protein YcbK (DUF882 family)